MHDFPGLKDKIQKRTKQSLIGIITHQQNNTLGIQRYRIHSLFLRKSHESTLPTIPQKATRFYLYHFTETSQKYDNYKYRCRY
jgi:hypothetical protein